jgi:hypothetical protein
MYLSYPWEWWDYRTHSYLRLKRINGWPTIGIGVDSEAAELKPFAIYLSLDPRWPVFSIVWYRHMWVLGKHSLAHHIDLCTVWIWSW